MAEEYKQDYETPVVKDYGDLLELTAAGGDCFTEDSADKTHHHHTQPCGP
jgi:hypothetical protein